MKTIETFKTEIKKLEIDYENIRKKLKERLPKDERKKLESEAKRLGTFAKTYRHYIAYLESEPSEEFIKHEIERLEAKIEVADKLFADTTGLPLSDPDYHKYMREHRKDNGLGNVENQLKTLKYLLAD